MGKSPETKLCEHGTCFPCVIKDSSIGKADIPLYPCLTDPNLQTNTSLEVITPIREALTDQAQAVLTTLRTWPPQNSPSK